MTDERFKELLNLFLDRELSPDEMKLLESEIARSESRRKEFEAACRLHHAMTCALTAEVAENEARCLLPRTRWLLGIGLAASFVIGGIFLVPAMTEVVIPERLEREPSLNSTRIVFANEGVRLPTMQLTAWRESLREPHSCQSLAAEFRLMGLEPSLVPSDRPLRPFERRSRQVAIRWNDLEGVRSFTTVSDSSFMGLERLPKGFPSSGPFTFERDASTFILMGAETSPSGWR